MRAFCSGLTLAKIVAPFTAAVSRESSIVVQVGAGEGAARGRRRGSRQTVSATRGLSPVTILTVMPSSASRAIDAAADGLGWSRKTRNPARVRSCSSSAVTAVELGGRPAGDGDHAVAGGELGVEHPVRLVGDVGAAFQDRFGSTLGDEEPLAVAVGEHRDAAAVVVEGSDRDPTEVVGGTRRRAPGASQRATSRGLPPTAVSPVRVASLHTSPRVSTSPLSSPVAVIARSKLMRPSVRVPVLSVNSTSMSPRSSMHTSRLTSTFFAASRREPVARLVDTTAGKQLGGDADRDGEGEQDRVDDRAAQRDVDHEDRDAEHATDLGEQTGEPGEAELELRLGVVFAEPDGDSSELGGCTRWPPPPRRRRPRAPPSP